MYRLLLFCFIFCLFVQCAPTRLAPVDKQATAETRHLYGNMRRLAQQGIMFGHQDDLAYGVKWKYTDGRSDVKEVVGDFPAVHGWDLGHLELGNAVNLDSVPFDRMRDYMQQVYAMGGLNTISWHLNNPVDVTKTSWDRMDFSIRRIFAEPATQRRYEEMLDKFAEYMKSLKGPRGELIPVVFRPFHEHTGSWFWWGRDHATPAEYIQMWRFTIDYLRQKEVNNLLIAYSTDRFASREEYLERYPGDAYVDIIGFDIYHRLPENADTAQINQEFVRDARRMVETVRAIGMERNKVWTLSETGLETIPVTDWWTNVLLPVVQDAGLSYVLVWRNGRPNHYYAPYPGHPTTADFRAFHQNPKTLFLKEVAAENIYTAPPRDRKYRER